MSQLNLSQMAIGVAVALAATTSFSAGLDRSGQDIKGFFNEGTYAEVDFVYIDTDITGHDNAAKDSIGIPIGLSETEDGYVKGNEINNITDDPYTFVRYGVKADVNDYLSVGVFYDEPWGAEVSHSGDTNFVAKPGLIAQRVKTFPGLTLSTQEIDPRLLNDSDYNKNTRVSVHTQSWTGLVGLKLDNGFQVYGGPVLQKAEAELHLRGNAYTASTGYDAIVNSDAAMGWAAGASYSIPEIMLNAALTYRSEIEHEAPIKETVPIARLNSRPTTYTNEATVTTPQSINLNLQSGLSKEYQLLGTLDVRWVPWSDFSIVPPAYNTLTKRQTNDDIGLPILSYDKDQFKVDVGLAKRFNPNLAGSFQVGWDSGAGNPTSSLGPIKGYYSVGGGLKYNVTPEWAVSAGGKYLMFGDATAELPTGAVVGKFEDNDGFIAGVKLSYQQK